MRDRVIHGSAIRRLRLELGLSRYEFARRSGVSVSYLKLLEGQPSPDKRWPSDRIAKILAETLGCDIADISQPTRRQDDVAA